MDRAYFAVFDGHGGADAARYASVHVHAVAARRPELAADPAEALRAAFRRTDEMFLWKARREVSAEWGRRDRPLRGRRRKGPCRSPLASASPCSCLNGPVAGTRVGLSPAEGVRASQGGQRDCLVIRGGGMTGAGLFLMVPKRRRHAMPGPLGKPPGSARGQRLARGQTAWLPWAGTAAS